MFNELLVLDEIAVSGLRGRLGHSEAAAEALASEQADSGVQLPAAGRSGCSEGSRHWRG